MSRSISPSLRWPESSSPGSTFRITPSRRAVAFTITELLIAIVIIGVIAALLISAIQSSAAASRNAKCISNLRQIGVAVRIYLNDNRNVMFPDERLNQPADKHGRWISALREVLEIPTSNENGQLQGNVFPIFICPSDPTRGGWRKDGGISINALDGEPGVNGVLARSYLPNRYVLARHLGEMPKPQEVIMFADFQWALIGTRAIWANGANWFENYPQKWHNGKLNCLFMDLHVDSVAINDLRWGKPKDYLWYPKYPELPMAK